jgi:hypothetical protein
MKRYIYVNYYSDQDPARRAENLQCLNSNLALPWLEQMFVFVDQPGHEQDLPNHARIQCIPIPRRMEFRDCIDHAQATLEPNSIFIILNLDIQIQDSQHWHRIDQDFFQKGYPRKAMVCKRHNLAADGGLWIEEASWQKGEFCDAYVMTTPLDPGFLAEDLDFCVGNAPQCDNTMMYLMNRYYHVYSWGSRYRIIHVDIVRRHDIPSGVIVNSTTDRRPSQRRDQHIDICAYQDWDQLLLTQQRPAVLPTWRIHRVSFDVDLPHL